jgi:hypothetical protein
VAEFVEADFDGRVKPSGAEAEDPFDTEYPDAESPCSEAGRPSSLPLAWAGLRHGDFSTTTKVKMHVIAAKAKAFDQNPPLPAGFLAAG